MIKFRIEQEEKEILARHLPANRVQFVECDVAPSERRSGGNDGRAAVARALKPLLLHPRNAFNGKEEVSARLMGVRTVRRGGSRRVKLCRQL